MPRRKNITKQRVQRMLEGKRKKLEHVQDDDVQTFQLFHAEAGSGHDNNSETYGHPENDAAEQCDDEEVDQPTMDTRIVDGIASNDGPEVINVQYAAEQCDESWFVNGTAPPFVTINGVPVPTTNLPDPRNGDGLVLELDSEHGDPYLSPFNGDYCELYHIVASVWEMNNVAQQITVGYTNRGQPRTWAKQVTWLGMNFCNNKTLRTTACRCVIMAIDQGLHMNPNRAFTFHLYVRSRLLAGKVKGFVRGATKAIMKACSVDDTGALVPFHKYIEAKMFHAIEQLPPLNQEALLVHMQNNNWRLNNGADGA